MKPTAIAETRIMTVIGLPLIFAYLADVLMVLTTKMVVGRLGAVELAAAGISTDLAYQMCIVLMGFFSVVGVLVAGARGAGRPEAIVPELLRGLLLAGVLGLMVTAIVLNLDGLLRYTGQDPEVIRLSQEYYTAFAYAVLPIIWFGVLRSFAAAMMKTGFVLAITVAAVALNYVLMQGLVHGQFGLPRLGIAGAGLAWAITTWLKVLCLGGHIFLLIRRQGLPLGRVAAALDLKAYLPLVRLGLPVAGIVAMEIGLFAVTALLSGAMGAAQLAAYQIVMGWISVPFVISLGFSEAAMVRVAYFAGARDQAAARQAGHLGMAVGVAVPLLLVLIPVFAPGQLMRVFLDPADPLYGQIAALVATLLLIGAVFQVFDSLQVIASHVLRGLKDAVVPMVIAAIGYWAVGLGGAYVLGFALGWGAPGLWWGLAMGLAFTAALLAWRFELLSRRQFSM